MIECLQIVKTPMGEILKRIPFITFLFLFTTLGCKISGPKTSTGPLANQTAILSAKAVPDIVAPGDTVQFICRITDSTNTKFRFYWYIFYGTTIGGKDTTYGGRELMSLQWAGLNGRHLTNCRPMTLRLLLMMAIQIWSRLMKLFLSP